MSSSDTAISVRGLSKAYTILHNATEHVTLAEVALERFRHPLRRAERERLLALQDLNFDVKAGEVLGLIGSNGAGKSTLLKVVSRITGPTEGEVRLWGRVGSLLEVGTGFHPELTGRENIYLNGAVLGMNRREIARQFDAIIEFAGVERFLDTPTKRYSSGMQVRLAFAVAAHLETEILLLDEVLAVGDRDFQARCLAKIAGLRQSGRAVILVSHNVGTVRKFATKALLLSNGRLIAHGSTDAVVDAYVGTRRELGDDVDLRGDRRNGLRLGIRARFNRLRLSHENGFVAADQDLRFTVEIESRDDLRNVWLGSAVRGVDGSMVGTCFSAPCIVLQAGTTCAFEVVVPCPRLAPGLYSMTLVLGMASGSTGFDDLDGVADCIYFEVEQSVDADGRVEHWDSAWGSVRLSSPIVSKAELLDAGHPRRRGDTA